MNNNEIVFETLEATGLNWTASKQELYTAKGIVVPDKFAVERSDNNTILGVVGNRYEFLQNKEAAHMIVESANGSFNPQANFHHPWDNASSLGSFGNIGGGSIGDGSGIFLQLELPSKYIGKSDVLRYITLTNKHDGSGSVGYGSTNQTVCCENTFAMANRFLSKFRHSASLQQRLDEAMRLFQQAMNYENSQLEVFENAANTRLEKNHIQDIVMSVFKVDVNKTRSDVSTRTQNNMKQFSNDIETSINEQGETLWALFNAVTRYTNHSTNRKDKTESLLFGTDAAISSKAYNTMLGWLNLEVA
tara:strand:+ start:530 stop:1441 length:912 start_codon:yes stop_codon:yes gene_type:complete